MSRVVEHLANLTGFRDRDVLDVTLVGALKDVLRPLSVAIYRCVGDDGAQRWLTRAHLLAGDSAATADPLWAEPDTLPLLTDHPDRHRCLLRQEAFAVEGPPALSYFPLATDHLPIGVVEIQTPQALSSEEVRLVSSILRLYRNYQGLLDYSERDTLTGLLNRKTFDENFLRQAAQPLALAAHQVGHGGIRRYGTHGSLWLGVLDIDHFKRVNDNFGHLIGDEVLLLLSRLMRSTFRFQDHLYRFGGEEFLVLMRCNDPGDVSKAFERLRGNVAAYAFPQVGRITVSVGFTEVRTSDSPSAAFERADKATYHAKQNGRNQVCHRAELVAAGKLADTARDNNDAELF